MNKKGFINIILIIVILMLGILGYFIFANTQTAAPQIPAPQPTQQPSVENTTQSTNTPTTETINTINGKNIYQNTTLNFQLTLPDKLWYFTPGQPDDPHLYATKKCYENAQLYADCQALEIQNNDADFSQGIDATFTKAKSDERKPVKLTSLIAGATVIKAEAPGPAEGWKYEYDLFFLKEQKGFLIFTNDEKLEKSILPTFKLIE